MTQEFKTAAVIGAGAWGTALAQTLARAGLDVTLWANEPATVRDINERHENPVFLPGVPLDPAIQATSAILQAARDKDLLVWATPAQFFRVTLALAEPVLAEGVPLAVASKGVEAVSGLLMSEVAAQITPGNPVAILSGPDLRARGRGRQTDGRDARLRGWRAWQCACRRLRHAFVPHLPVRRRGGCPDRRGGQERDRAGLRHRRRAQARRQRARRPDDARPCRDGPPRACQRRAGGNAYGPHGPRGSGTHLQQRPVAQHAPRHRHRRRHVASRTRSTIRNWACAMRSSRASRVPRPSAISRGASVSTCRSAAPSRRSCTRMPTSRPRSPPCWPGH